MRVAWLRRDSRARNHERECCVSGIDVWDGEVMDHDIVRTDVDGVVCACGRRFENATKHAGHWGIEKARAALRGDKEGQG